MVYTFTPRVEGGKVNPMHFIWLSQRFTIVYLYYENKTLVPILNKFLFFLLILILKKLHKSTMVGNNGFHTAIEASCSETLN